MSLFCPSCNRVLYNRRLKHCGFCGAAIPEALRFSQAEIAVLDRKLAELEESRKQRLLAEEAARAAALAQQNGASADAAQLAMITMIANS